MDRIDKKILSLLQKDATLTVNQIAESVNLSTTPCWRRIQNLEKQGIIDKRVTLLHRDPLNLGVDVFASVRRTSWRHFLLKVWRSVHLRRQPGANAAALCSNYYVPYLLLHPQST